MSGRVCHSSWCGLRSATRTRVPAHSASWADSLRMIRSRHPEVADTTSAPLRRATQICELEVIPLRSGKTFQLLCLVLWQPWSLACWPFRRMVGNMTLRWFLSSPSRTPWWFLVPLLPSRPCSAHKVALCLASLSPLCLSPPLQQFESTCSGFSCCVASTFLSHSLFRVLLLRFPLPLSRFCRGSPLDCLGHHVPVVPGQGFWGGAASHWSLQWHASVGRLAPECLPMCSCVTSTFPLAQWTNAESR